MTEVVLRPNGTHTAGAGVTYTGGATWTAVTADDSDATWAEVPSTPSTTATLSLTTVTLPTGAWTKTARVRMRIRSASATVPTMQTSLADAAGVNYPVFATKTNQSTTITTITGSTTVMPVLTQAEVDGLRLKPSAIGGGVAGRFLELYVDLTYATLPVVDVTAPTGTYTTNSRPNVEWTYTQGSDGGAQAFYRVRIFTAAQYGIGGFDAATSPSTTESGTVAGNATSYDPYTAEGRYLANAVYRAYVRTAQVVNGASHWSDWDYIDFTLNVTAPSITSVTVEQASAGYGTWQESSLPNNLSVADNAAIQAVTGLDVRFAVTGAALPAATQYIALHGTTTASNNSWNLRVTTGGLAVLALSSVASGGTTSTTDTSDAVLTDSDDLVLGRVTWRNSDGRVQFLRKLGIAEGDIAGELVANTGWEQIGNDSTMLSGLSLFNSTASLIIGGKNASSEEWVGRIYGFVLGLAPDAVPGLTIYPDDWPTNTAASNFTASSSQTVTVTRDGTATQLALTAPAAKPGIKVIVTRNTAGSEWTHVTVNRSADAGATWEFVRRASLMEYDGDPFIVTDYEAERGTGYLYRAQGSVYDTGTALYVDGATSTSSSATWTDTSSWLKAIDDPALDRTVRFREAPSFSRERRAGTFEVLGSSLPVVVADVLGGATFTAALLTLTDDEAEDLTALVESTQPLLFQPRADVHLEEMWVVVTQTALVHTALKLPHPEKSWDLALVRVARPADTTGA